MAFACRLFTRGISRVSVGSAFARRSIATAGILHQNKPEVSTDGIIDPVSSESVDTADDSVKDFSLKDFRVYQDAGKEPFSADVLKKLHSGINMEEIEIKPDGLLYLPEIKYRRKLNEVFGPGGWALIPLGDPLQFEDDRGSCSLVTREYCLYCFGRFVSQTVGEHTFYSSRDRNMQYGKALESAKSNALMRCCKDLGIASELWDPDFILDWKKNNAVQVWIENVQTKQKRKVWRKKGRDPEVTFNHPWREITDVWEVGAGQ